MRTTIYLLILSLPLCSAPLVHADIGDQLFKLTPADGAALDNFGWGVALNGDTALVGAGADNDNGTRSGSAYLFDAARVPEPAALTLAYLCLAGAIAYGRRSRAAYHAEKALQYSSLLECDLRKVPACALGRISDAYKLLTETPYTQGS